MDYGVVSLARLCPVRGRRARIKYVIGLMDLDEAFRHSWYQSKKFAMADRRDWGGGGDDPEENTQRIIERIWESLTDIRMRMDQQAPVPPVAIPPGDRETVPIAPVPPRVEVPFVETLPPPPPVLVAEEPVMQVEKFLRLQPPTYSGGPNPDIAEHWVHEIERVKEEDGEVYNNFSKVVVGQRWRNHSRVLPDSPLFHQGIDVILAISRGI
ncbi:hypothetical protein Taro_011339 [Colocasia esculenta]|uniref:Uncharacterized protein n=1 Tax=Colocasia esculenta TaxID=4460 RepID=A0A843U603_COLES|nr:hypothetical protein [Colocasia esculenta]